MVGKRVVAAFLMAAVVAVAAGSGHAAPAEQLWLGEIVYFDDTVEYEQIADVLVLERIGDTSEFGVSARLDYITVGGHCTFIWAKTFDGLGTLNDAGTEIRFEGVETVKNTSTCLDSNTKDDAREKVVTATLEGERLTGFIFGGEFTVEGFVLGTPGVEEHDGNLYLTSPPDGTLSIRRDDLPVWARFEVVTVGAIAIHVGPPDIIKTGDPAILIDGLPVARLGDTTAHGGEIVSASDRIFANGVPVAVLLSETICPMITPMVPHVGGPIATTGPGPSDGWAADADSIAAIVATSRAAAATRAAAQAGDTRLDVDASGFEVGDGVSIGGPEEPFENAVVAGKGSIILDRPLQHDYPEGTFVIQLDPDSTKLIIPAGEVATTGDTAEQPNNSSDAGASSDEPDDAQPDDAEPASENSDSSPVVPIAIAAALIALFVGGVMAWRRKRNG